MNGRYDFTTLAQAQARMAELVRLNWRVFPIFQTPNGWAFFVNGPAS